MSISQKSSQQSHEAVLFFEGPVITREMLYAEFEALLDCVVPIRDFAGKELRAAYVRLDAGLQPSVVVLFLIPFDQEGFAEQRWNLPLRQLAESSQRSVHPGTGGVRLASRSNCPLSGWERGLWDPEYSPGGNTLELLRERLGMNRLGLEDSSSAGATARTEQPALALDPTPLQAAQGQTRQESTPGSQEAVLALMQQSNLQIGLIREQSQREIGTMQHRLAEFRQRCETLEAARLSALGELDTLRTRSQQELESVRARLDAEAESVARLSEQAASLQAALERNDEAFAAERSLLRAEVSRLEEQVHSLSVELTSLRRDKLRLMDDGAESFFAALKEKNVNFVTFQPGAGHITIPADDLSRFLGETEAYVAAKCNVSAEHYRRWLQHYNNPVCQGTSGTGAPCAKAVTKILKPAEFTAGLQDRCDIHKQIPRSQPARSANP